MIGLPTPRTTLRTNHVTLLVWCKGVSDQADARLQRLVEAGRGDVPLIHLKFRCSNCGSDRTDWAITGRGAATVQPWQRSAQGWPT